MRNLALNPKDAALIIPILQGESLASLIHMHRLYNLSVHKKTFLVLSKEKGERLVTFETLVTVLTMENLNS